MKPALLILTLAVVPSIPAAAQAPRARRGGPGDAVGTAGASDPRTASAGGGPLAGAQVAVAGTHRQPVRLAHRRLDSDCDGHVQVADHLA